MFQILGRFGAYLLANWGSLAAGYFVADTINNLSDSPTSNKGVVPIVEKYTGLKKWQAVGVSAVVLFILFWFFFRKPTK